MHSVEIQKIPRSAVLVKSELLLKVYTFLPAIFIWDLSRNPSRSFQEIFYEFLQGFLIWYFSRHHYKTSNSSKICSQILAEIYPTILAEWMFLQELFRKTFVGIPLRNLIFQDFFLKILTAFLVGISLKLSWAWGILSYISISLYSWVSM